MKHIYTIYDPHDHLLHGTQSQIMAEMNKIHPPECEVKSWGEALVVFAERGFDVLIEKKKIEFIASKGNHNAPSSL